jgi:hypothetical protein
MSTFPRRWVLSWFSTPTQQECKRGAHRHRNGNQLLFVRHTKKAHRFGKSKPHMSKPASVCRWRLAPSTDRSNLRTSKRARFRYVDFQPTGFGHADVGDRCHESVELCSAASRAALRSNAARCLPDRVQPPSHIVPSRGVPSGRAEFPRKARARFSARRHRIQKNPDAADRRQDHGSHRGGHQPDACQLVWLLQTRQGQRTWRHRRMDTHAIAIHLEKATRLQRPRSRQRPPTLAQRAKQHVAKIQRHITQPLPPQLAPQRPCIPRGKVKSRQIRHAPLHHQPLSKRHMPPCVRDAHLSERDGKNTSNQGKPPSRFFEALGRPYISIDCGCFPHPSIPIALSKKIPAKNHPL